MDTIPSSIEQHGAEWPVEWPKRLETYPEWLNDKEKLIADTNHWKAIVDKSYLTGIGIDWSNIRNVLDMKAIYGGYATKRMEESILFDIFTAFFFFYIQQRIKWLDVQNVCLCSSLKH